MDIAQIILEKVL